MILTTAGLTYASFHNNNSFILSQNVSKPSHIPAASDTGILSTPSKDSAESSVKDDVLANELSPSVTPTIEDLSSTTTPLPHSQVTATPSIMPPPVLSPNVTAPPAPTFTPNPTPFTPTATPQPTPIPEGYEEVLAAVVTYDAAAQLKSKTQRAFLDTHNLPYLRPLDDINLRMGPTERKAEACRLNTESALEKLQTLQAEEPRDEDAIALAQSEYDAALAEQQEAEQILNGIYEEFHTYTNSPEFKQGEAEKDQICHAYYEAEAAERTARENLKQLQDQYGIYLRDV